MESETSESRSYPGSGDRHIPIDLFGSKKQAGVPRGVLAFADASGNIVFKVNRPHPDSSRKKILLDASATPLFSIHRLPSGFWKCYKGDSNEEKELVFSVKRTLKTLSRVELDVFFKGEKLKDGECDLKVRGSPFKRSCNIYKDNDLVAQDKFLDGEWENCAVLISNFFLNLTHSDCLRPLIYIMGIEPRGSMINEWLDSRWTVQRLEKIHFLNSSLSNIRTSLMYKLHQIFVSRGKFRLTIFPGTFDHALIVALFVLFLNGRK